MDIENEAYEERLAERRAARGVEEAAMRKDAERYRWLRGLDGSCDSAACVNFNIGFDWIEAHGVALDEAIDAAMNGANP